MLALQQLLSANLMVTGDQVAGLAAPCKAGGGAGISVSGCVGRQSDIGPSQV